VNAIAESVHEANESISLEEAIKIGSEDPDFYGQFFFPKTCRQDGAPMHQEMWEALLSNERFVSFMVHRDGAKTTIIRLFLSFCIAYGISRTILVVGKSEGAAVRTVEWLQRAVEFNPLWANAFGLRKGSKWSGGEIDIWHGTDKVPIRVIAVGITGSTRGINVDDYRPDLILVDDPCDEENTATPDARKKTADLFFGALQKSLAPASEAPLAKLMLAQTVLNDEDLISLTIKDKQWLSLVFSCFDANGDSRWSARYPTHVLRADKQAHIDRGMLSLWLREMECKVIDDETARFPSNFLQYWEVVPEGGRTVLALDPTPPPREGEIAKVNTNLDDAAILVLREYAGNVYVLDRYVCKSPDPDELMSKIFELCVAWNAREVYVETILFARVLANLLNKEQLKRRMWLTVHQVEDKRKKSVRISQNISPLYVMRKLFFHPTQGDLIEQLTRYPNVPHDDMLDALSIGLEGLSAWMTDIDDSDSVLQGELMDKQDAIDYPPEDVAWEGCP